MVQGRRMCFVWNNPTNQLTFEEGPEGKVRYLVYQYEIGESGTPHYQGYAEFKGMTTHQQASRWLNCPGAHWELCIGSQEENIHYCTKPHEGCECENCSSAMLLEDGGVLDGPWIHGIPAKTGRPKKGNDAKADEIENEKLEFVYQRFKEGWTEVDFWHDNHVWITGNYLKKVKDLIHLEDQEIELEELKDDARLKMLTANPMQKLALQKVLAQDDRKITCIVDPKGNSGKTTLSTMLELIYDYQAFPNAKTGDIAYSVKESSHRKGFIIDLARSLQKTDVDGKSDDFINYTVIENLKDGKLFSSKYKSVNVRFKSPKVLILMNFWPNLTKLSMDRWDIIEWTAKDREGNYIPGEAQKGLI